ncbi:MAG TPA: hypothetical protein VFV92_15395 [Candidatus Bathyarchaeia archaeon]|nr:hypothetical protein [Candidatus Bathyarchaeia archaeon]
MEPSEGRGIPTLNIPRQIFGKRKVRDFGVTRTLRLNSEVDTKLDDLSKKKGFSVNVLANKAIRKFVDWDSSAEVLGIVSTSKYTLRFLWDSLPEEKARALGRKAGGQAAVEFSNFWFKKFSWDTMIEAARLWSAEYGGVYHFQHDYSDSSEVHTLVSYHDLGRNFTSYLSEAFKETIKLLVADFEVTESEKRLVIHVKR